MRCIYVDRAEDGKISVCVAAGNKRAEDRDL
jgi:hypothetical protein